MFRLRSPGKSWAGGPPNPLVRLRGRWGCHTPYEALYGRKCRSPLYWDEVGEKNVLDPTVIPWMEDAQEKVKLIRQRL